MLLNRISLVLGLVVAAAVAAVATTGWLTSEAAHSFASIASAGGCEAGPPPIAKGVQETVARPLGAEVSSVGSIVGDATVTIVSMCIRRPELPPEAPALSTGHRTIQPFGGFLEKTPRGWVNHLLYPGLPGRSVTMLSPSEPVLSFVVTSDARPERCPEARSSSLKIERCGILLVARWQTRWKPPSDVAVQIIHGVFRESSGKPLGFYLQRSSQRRDGLEILAAFTRPMQGAVIASLEGVETRTGFVRPAKPVRVTARLTG